MSVEKQTAISGRDRYGAFVVWDVGTRNEMRSAMPDDRTARRCAASQRLLDACKAHIRCDRKSHPSECWHVCVDGDVRSRHDSRVGAQKHLVRLRLEAILFAEWEASE